jgi:hypothetical protein
VVTPAKWPNRLVTKCFDEFMWWPNRNQNNPTLTPSQGSHLDSINSAKTWNGCVTKFYRI